MQSENKESGKKSKNVFIAGIHINSDNCTMSEAIKKFYSTHPSLGVQIFTHGPLKIINNNGIITHNSGIDKIQLKKITKYLKIFIHSPYVQNIFKKENGKSLRIMHDIMKTADDINSSGVILHLPKAEAGVVVTNVKKLLKKMEESKITVPIILETPSNKSHPTMSWESPEKITHLCLEMEKNGITPNMVGVCIDTAHIYAGGAKISTREEAQQYIKKLPIKWITLIHLNGNEYEYPKGGDKHAIPGNTLDAVWKGKKFTNSGVYEFVELAKIYNIPIIFECTKNHDRKDVLTFVNKCGYV